MADEQLVQVWSETQDTSVQFDVDGRIMDFLEAARPKESKIICVSRYLTTSSIPSELEKRQ